jgi:curved DNA-binding protein CbpA
MENLYDILEVSRKASKEIIEKAYKTLAKKYHPDLQSEENKKYAEEKMKKINEAYRILSDEQKRAEYDKKLEEQEQIANQNNNSYNDAESHEYTTNNQYVQYDSNIPNNQATRQGEYSNLSYKEQAKIRKKLEKEAAEGYRKSYADYLRRLGYKIKYRWTFKDFVTLIIVILVLAIIFSILWLIPPVRNWMLNIYNENLAIKIIVNVIIGIFKGIAQFFNNIFNSNIQL